MLDKMMDVKLANGVVTNDTGKQFSTRIYNRKPLAKIIAIFQGIMLSNLDGVLLWLRTI